MAQKVEGGYDSRDVEDILILYDPLPPQSHHNGAIACDGLLSPIDEGNIVPTGRLMVWQ